MTDDPDGEYGRRLAAVQVGLRADGLDAIVAEDLGDWLAPTGDARYLTGFTISNLVGAFRGVQIVVPAEGRPVLVVPKGPQGAFVEWARRTAIGAEVGEASDPVAGVSEAVRAIGGVSRLATGLAYRDVAALAAGLPGIEVAPSRRPDALQRARAVKSEVEIALLSAAQRAAEAGMCAFLDAVEPGRPNREAQAVARSAVVQAGADDGLVIMNAGSDPWMWWHYQGDRVFPDRGIVTFEINARVAGYCAQLARTGTIGEPDELQARLLDAGRRGADAMVATLRPGATGHEVAHVGAEVLREAGFQPWGRLGHGMGLAMDEGVSVIEREGTPIEAGSVVAVHACPWDAATRQSVLIGEQYTIREDGPEPLSTTTPDRVFILNREVRR